MEGIKTFINKHRIKPHTSKLVQNALSWNNKDTTRLFQGFRYVKYIYTSQGTGEIESDIPDFNAW